MERTSPESGEHRRQETHVTDERGEQKELYVYTDLRDGTYYCGWTNDLDKRLAAHNEGRGAKYTKPRRPVRLSYWEAFDTKEEAMRREGQ